MVPLTRRPPVQSAGADRRWASLKTSDILRNPRERRQRILAGSGGVFDGGPGEPAAVPVVSVGSHAVMLSADSPSRAPATRRNLGVVRNRRAAHLDPHAILQPDQMARRQPAVGRLPVLP